MGGVFHPQGPTFFELARQALSSTQEGYDLPLTAAVSGAVRIPVIASGGVGTLEHLCEGLQAGASAVLAASIFHFGTHDVPEAKQYLASRGVRVRPVDDAEAS